LETCKKVDEYQLRIASGQAAYADCVRVLPSAKPSPPPQKEPRMSAFVPPDTPPVHPCPYHPNREQHTGKGGKRLGVCKECLSTRQSVRNLTTGQDKGRFVQVYFRDNHLDLKAWLDKEALKNERTIQQEIIYLLRQAKARTEPNVEEG
jgi:hypothetical protein